MTQDAILAKVEAILRDIFDDNTIVVTESTAAKDVAEWDSLNNIQIIIAIEKFYKIRFKTAEIQGWQNVGEMRDSILKYLGSK